MRSLAWLCLVLLASCAERPYIPTYGGGEARLDDWRERWIVINYWAEWCAPCRTEIPEFNHLYADSNGRELIVVGVNYDGFEGEALGGILERMDVNFPTLLQDPYQLLEYERPKVLPTTIVIGPGYEVREILQGPQTLASLRTSLESLRAAHTVTGTNTLSAGT